MLGMKRSKIAFFDSGVGGLSMLQMAMQLLPHEDFLFYADSAHAPYGDKERSEVLVWIQQAFDELSAMPLKALVIPCYTTATLLGDIRWHPISIPLITCAPVIKQGSRRYDPRKILVMGTALMIDNCQAANIIEGLDEKEDIDYINIQELVSFADEFDFDSKELLRYLKHKIGKLGWEQYHTVVLACSHLHYFKNHLKRVIPCTVDILDSQGRSIKALKDVLPYEASAHKQELQCMLSGKEVAREIVSPYFNYLKSNDFFNAGSP